MKTSLSIVCLLIALGAIGAYAAEPTHETQNRPRVTLSGVEYFHRWSKGDQHEFTPAGQEDLGHWTDMVTINSYRNVKDGEGLAATANAVLGAYKSRRAIIVKTSSVPRTSVKPAEYLVVALFPTPDFIEAVFSRFRMVRGLGTSTVYSHREYGQKVGDRMSAWLQKNGASAEKALMSLGESQEMDAANYPR